jgi:hypothetical protein
MLRHAQGFVGKKIISGRNSVDQIIGAMFVRATETKTSP